MSAVGLIGLLAFGPVVSQAFGQEGEADQTVLLTNIEFKPNQITVKAGDTIKFTNRDKFKHDVYLVRTANRNVVIVPATTIEPGKSVIITMKEEGLFSLYCTIHGGMRGMVSTTGKFELSDAEKKKFAHVKVIPPIVHLGEELFWGRAQCFRCHKVGDRGDGLQGPNLQDIGFRAAARARKLGLGSATAYIVQSVMHPEAVLVEGYSNAMPKVYQPPIDLNEDEIKAIIAYLQSQGGDVDTWAIEINQQLLDTTPGLDPFRFGDPARGKLVFKKTGCNSCHAVGNEKAVSIGPELTAIGAYHNWSEISTSIIQPNAEIGKNWTDVIVYLKDGDAIPGVLRKNSTDEVILLVGPGDKTRTIPGDQVDEVRVSTMTRMAANYAELLTFRQMADLVSYLESLKGEPAEPPSKTATAGTTH